MGIPKTDSQRLVTVADELASGRHGFHLTDPDTGERVYLSLTLQDSSCKVVADDEACSVIEIAYREGQIVYRTK